MDDCYIMNEAQIIDQVSQYQGRRYSQLGQDLLALSVNSFKRNGFFVEFGALDGIQDSNTYLLEKEFGWTGILAEPANIFRSKLADNRSSIVDHRAVAGSSGQILEFKETMTQLGFSGLIDYFDPNDMHAVRRKESLGEIYSVTTVSLNDLLSEHNAPKIIDYMSVDTEGSELSILENFDFNKHQINLLTVEHNYNTHTRKLICDLLESNGFKRVLTDLSDIDDWYVHSSLIF